MILKKKFIFIAFINFLLASCSTQQLAVSDRDLDSDLDGIHDLRDACPKLPGSVFNLGCPEDQNLQLSSLFDKEKSTDSDLDGVPDDKDDCPLVYGSPFNMGCPFSGE